MNFFVVNDINIQQLNLIPFINFKILLKIHSKNVVFIPLFDSNAKYFLCFK